MSAANVLGLDLSLTSSGVCGPATFTIKSKMSGYPRLREIRQRILTTARAMHAQLIVIEGPAFSRVGSGQHERGGLWWMVTEELDTAGYPLAVVSPSALKKYATGKGNAGKDDMILAAARRFPDFAGGNDEADALWLRAMGCDHIGDPLCDLPAKNREALSSVPWPEMAVAA